MIGSFHFVKSGIQMIHTSIDLGNLISENFLCSQISLYSDEVYQKSQGGRGFDVSTLFLLQTLLLIRFMVPCTSLSQMVHFPPRLLSF